MDGDDLKARLASKMKKEEIIDNNKDRLINKSTEPKS
jgi:hypothetical protein